MEMYFVSFLIAGIQFLSTFASNRIFLLPKNHFSIIKIVFAVISGVLACAFYELIGVYTAVLVFMMMTMFNYSDLKKLLPSLGYASLAAIITIIADHAASLIDTVFKLSSIFSVVVYTFIHLVIAAVLTLGLTLLIKRILYYYLSKGLDSREGQVVTLVLFFTYTVYLLCIFLGVSLGNTPELIQLNLVFFTIYLVFSLVAFAFYSNSLRKEFHLKQKETEYKAIQRYTDDLEANYNQIRKFRHDYQNILSSLDSYIVEEDMSGLVNYYQEVIRPSSKYMEANHFKLSELSNIQIKELKSVIASKLMYAQELGIDASLEAKEAITTLNFDSLSLIRILGIFLDNAIEELVSLGSGTLRIAVIPYEQITQIIIENTCRKDIEPLHTLKKNGFSTKGKNRGLGLSNVDELIKESEKKNTWITVETIIEQETFVQILNIPKA